VDNLASFFREAVRTPLERHAWIPREMAELRSRFSSARGPRFEARFPGLICRDRNRRRDHTIFIVEKEQPPGNFMEGPSTSPRTRPSGGMAYFRIRKKWKPKRSVTRYYEGAALSGTDLKLLRSVDLDCFRSREIAADPRKHSGCHVALMEILDVFVRVGWPRAYHLTYLLGEICR